jgi:metal-responsive CopG/Arc/MetJ family transcriptional regulator
MKDDRVEIELELEEDIISFIDAMVEEQNSTRDEVVEQILRDFLDSL